MTACRPACTNSPVNSSSYFFSGLITHCSRKTLSCKIDIFFPLQHSIEYLISFLNDLTGWSPRLEAFKLSLTETTTVCHLFLSARDNIVHSRRSCILLHLQPPQTRAKIMSTVHSDFYLIRLKINIYSSRLINIAFLLNDCCCFLFSVG